jgi:hypothetical protein
VRYDGRQCVRSVRYGPYEAAGETQACRIQVPCLANPDSDTCRARSDKCTVDEDVAGAGIAQSV